MAARGLQTRSCDLKGCRHWLHWMQGNGRFWGKWTAGVMALRGGHQSRPGRPLEWPCLKVERRTDTSRQKASSCGARTKREGTCKIVTECRQRPVCSGPAKQIFVTDFHTPNAGQRLGDGLTCEPRHCCVCARQCQKQNAPPVSGQRVFFEAVPNLYFFRPKAMTRASCVTTNTLPSATTGSLKCTQSFSVLPLVHSRLPVSAS